MLGALVKALANVTSSKLPATAQLELVVSVMRPAVSVPLMVADCPLQALRSPATVGGLPPGVMWPLHSGLGATRAPVAVRFAAAALPVTVRLFKVVSPPTFNDEKLAEAPLTA